MIRNDQDLARIDFAKGDGLVPVIVQDAASARVLMLGYMNPEALERTLQTGQVTFHSRSKQRLWTKGESSGHVLKVEEIRVDCDQDALLLDVEPGGDGKACHTGRKSCFYRRVQMQDGKHSLIFEP